MVNLTIRNIPQDLLEKIRRQAKQPAISLITVAELYYGVEKSANPQKKNVLEQFLKPGGACT